MRESHRTSKGSVQGEPFEGTNRDRVIVRETRRIKTAIEGGTILDTTRNGDRVEKPGHASLLDEQGLSRADSDQKRTLGARRKRYLEYQSERDRECECLNEKQSHCAKKEDTTNYGGDKDSLSGE